MSRRHRIQEIHPYEVSEIIALKAEMVSESYLEWLMGQVGAP